MLAITNRLNLRKRMQSFIARALVRSKGGWDGEGEGNDEAMRTPLALAELVLVLAGFWHK